MSQQIISVVSVVGPDDDMGDFEFIQGKVIAGNYFQVSGDINNLNDTIEYVVPNDKTAFMIKAKIVISTHVSPPAMVNNTVQNTIVKDIIKAALKIDTVIKDITNIGTSASVTNNGNVSPQVGGSGVGNVGDGKFDVLGLSLVGNNVKKIEIENILDDGSAFATMSGYLIDT